MSDTLEIFGTEYTNVAGFKATDDNSQTKTYIRPQGTKSISANGTSIDVTAYAAVDVAVPAPSPSLQTKTKSYTPSETAQSETVSADTGYDGLDEVSISVGAISSTYVGSGVTRQGATTYRAGTSQQTIASGTYLTGTQTIAAVSQTNLSAENIKSGTTISISNGQSDIWSVIGTYTGGGGATLLGTKEFTVSTTSTTATSVGNIDISPESAIWTTDAIIYVKIRDKAGARNGYFFGSDNFFVNYQLASGATSNVQTVGKIIYYYDSSNVYKPYTSGYGVYAYQITGGITHKIEIYRRYNSNYTKTINGTFKAEVYSIPMSKLFGSQT